MNLVETPVSYQTSYDKSALVRISEQKAEEKGQESSKGRQKCVPNCKDHY